MKSLNLVICVGLLTNLFALPNTLQSAAIAYDPGAPTTLGIKGRIFTTEKTAEGTFINHLYYPGPGIDDWYGGNQVNYLSLDNQGDGRGDFRLEASVLIDGSVNVRAHAEVFSGSQTSGNVSVIFAQSYTNISTSEIFRTFTLGFSGDLMRVAEFSEAYASAEVFFFEDDLGFTLDDPFTLIGAGVPQKSFPEVDPVTGRPANYIELDTDSLGQVKSSNVTITFAPGETVNVITKLDAQADLESFARSFNTFNLSVDMTGLSAGMSPVPEPSTATLVLSAIVVGAIRYRNRM